MANQPVRPLRRQTPVRESATTQGVATPISTRQQLPRLIAVVPAFNEVENINTVIGELQVIRDAGVSGAKLSTPYTLDFFVIDDGSRDQTDAVARAAGAKVVVHPFNMGIGITVQTGFQVALDAGADYVVQVDGDGQHIAAEIPTLFSFAMQTHADIVVGTRFAENARVGMESTTLLRWLAGRLLSAAVFLLTRKRLSDPTSGFRLYNRRAAEFVATQYPDDYPEVEILVTLVRHGFRVEEVPVRMRSRMHGHSSINWWRSIYYVVKVLFAAVLESMRARRKP